ncbi:hypothetical protein, partial [Campylobacter molothri]|uniref:hypothetical protein n=1 Tax=Campylobacter molothri TaxID=1032242 RepID=UPI00301D258E
MKIVLLGSCESRWNLHFAKGFREYGCEVKPIGYGMIHPLGWIYFLLREKNKKIIEKADLIIFSPDASLFYTNDKFVEKRLSVYDCIYKILSNFQKKILVIQWFQYVFFGGRYIPFHKIQSEKYGFNFIDTYEFYLKENLSDFYTNIIDMQHPMEFVFTKMAQNICENFNFFKCPKKIQKKSIPNFKILDLNEIFDTKKHKDFLNTRSYLCRESIYKLDSTKILYLNCPEKYLGMKIIGTHVWNDCFTSKDCYSYYVIENKTQKVAGGAPSYESFRSLEYDFIIDKETKIHNRIDHHVKRPQYDYPVDDYVLKYKQIGIIGFLLMSKEENFEEIKIPESIDFKISKEYDFTHLCKYLKEYKIIIEQYNQRKDPIKLQNLQAQISNLIQEKQNLQNNFQAQLNSIPIKKQHLELANLEQDLIIKKLESKKLAKSLGIKMDIINPRVTFIQANSAKARIQNQLSYKLGQAMIENSKSILGYIRMPYVLSYIKDKHKQEQKIYQEKIKKDPSLKLPPLESYPDYNEALKFKEHLSYKLGQALIKANNNWYGGGYIK